MHIYIIIYIYIIFVYNIDIHVWYGKSKASADWEVLLKILTQPPSKSAGTETGIIRVPELIGI